ncbi:MAG: hypothetical protein K6G50_04940 [bacterium]|nr:hypothetical protein [bacterium]
MNEKFFSPFRLFLCLVLALCMLAPVLAQDEDTISFVWENGSREWFSPKAPARLKYRHRFDNPVNFSLYSLDIFRYAEKSCNIDEIIGTAEKLSYPDRMSEHQRELAELLKPVATWQHDYCDTYDDICHEETVAPADKCGVYVVAASCAGLSRAKIIVISKAEQFAVSHPGHEIIWCTDADGKVLAPEKSCVSHIDDGKIVCEKVMASSSGLIDLLPRGQQLLVAASGDYIIVKQLDSEVEVQPLRAVLITDCSKAAPGDKIGWRAFIRERRGGIYTVPEIKSCHVLLYDPNGQMAVNSEALVNPSGIVRGDFPLAKNAAVGQWKLAVEHENEVLATGVVQVENNANKLNVIIAAAGSSFKDGDEANVEIEVRGSDGNPVNGAEITWKIADFPHAWRFSHGLAPWNDNAEIRSNKPLEVIGISRTDLAGRSSYVVKIKRGGAECRLCDIVAEVKSRDGRSGRAFTELVVGREPGYIDVSAPAQGIVGEPVFISAQLKDRAGNPVEDEIEFSALTDDDSKVIGKVKADATGTARIEWKPDQAGTVKIKASSAFPEKSVSDAVSLLVLEKNTRNLFFSFDKASYKPGESARVRLHVSAPNVNVLFAAEGAGVSWRFVVCPPAADTEFSVPILAGAPEYTMRAFCAGAGARQTYSARVATDIKPLLLNVACTPLSAPEAGGTGKVKVVVTDSEGKPAEAEVSLYLSGPMPRQKACAESLVSSFYGRGGRDADLSASGACSYSEENRVRVGDASSDSSSGVAEFNVNWPKTEGYWNVMVAAISSDKIGGIQMPWLLVKSVTVGIEGPSRIMKGDILEYTAELESCRQEDVEVSLSVTSGSDKVLAIKAVDGFKPKEQKLVLSHGNSRFVKIQAEALGYGRGEIAVALQGKGIKEKVSKKVLVAAGGCEQRISAVKEIIHSGNVSFAAVPGEISALSALDIEFSQGLGGLLSTSSANILSLDSSSVSLAARLLPSHICSIITFCALPEPQCADDADRAKKDALNDLAEMQNQDGSFSWWPDLPADNMITAFVCDMLRRTKGSHDVSVLVEGEKYLAKMRCDDISERIYALYVLSYSKQAPVAELLELAKKDIDLAEKFQIVSALSRMGQKDKAQKLLEAALSGLKKGEEPLAFYSGKCWSLTETASFALGAILDANPASPLLSACAEAIIANYKAGTWQSVRETCLASAALAAFLQNQGEKGGTSSCGIWLNGNELISGQKPASDWCKSTFITLSGAQLPAEDWEIESIKSGSHRAWLSAVKTAVVEQSPEAADSAFSVDRQYFIVKDGKRVPVKDGDKLALGDKIEAVVTVKASQKLNCLCVDEQLPANITVAETVKGKLRAESGLGVIRLSVPSLEPGSHEFTWKGTADMPGCCTAPGVKAYLLHAPERMARTTAAKITVAE